MAREKSKSNLATIIYLYDITESRMKGSTPKNLRMFESVCGGKAIPNVIVVMTKWKNVPTENGERREKELKRDFWKDLIADGCEIARFENSYESAWSIIDKFGTKDRAQVLLPREIVDSKRRLNETRAGITLSKALEELIKRQKEADRRLQELAQSQDNELSGAGAEQATGADRGGN